MQPDSQSNSPPTIRCAEKCIVSKRTRNWWRYVKVPNRFLVCGNRPNRLPSPFPLRLGSTQVDEHSLELYVVTPDGIAVTQRVHAAVLICVKTAAILGAVLALGPLSEEDYMRLVKQALEPKDRLVGITGCQHPWPCYGKPAIIFHDRGKIFTRRSCPPGVGGSTGHLDFASAALCTKSLGNRGVALSMDDPAF